MTRPSKRRSWPLSKSEQMARVRSRNTEPERMLRRALWGAGLRYRLRLQLPGSPDVAFPGPKVAVFVDGCFWHGCPEHYTAPVRQAEFWAAKLGRNRARDEHVDAELSALGWRSVRVWEHSVQRDLPAVVRRLRNLIRGSDGLASRSHREDHYTNKRLA